MYILNPSPLTCSKWRYPDLQSRLFLQYEKTALYQNQCRKILLKGQKALQLPLASDLSDDAIWCRIQCAWWLAKEDIAIRKFSSHLEATMVNKGL